MRFLARRDPGSRTTRGARGQDQVGKWDRHFLLGLSGAGIVASGVAGAWVTFGRMEAPVPAALIVAVAGMGDRESPFFSLLAS